MAGASETYHEAQELLTERTRDMHRALVSLQEELEAVDWYQQRADATSDEQLRAILLHNMRDEMEHACMVLEWIRRQSESMDEQLKTYLFTKEPITEIEEAHEGGGGGAWRNLDNGTFVKSQPTMRLTVGSLKGK
ncbi:MAG: ferritin [Pseudomonadota bacterium]|jgi:ferritin-like protein|nr:ferritin [Pseudomonadota bacterium]